MLADGHSCAHLKPNIGQLEPRHLVIGIVPFSAIRDTRPRCGDTTAIIAHVVSAVL